MRSSRHPANRWPAVLVAIVFPAFLTGCASTHRTVDIDRSALRDRPAVGCRINVVEVVDSVGTRAHVGTGGDTWRIVGLADRVREQIDGWQPVDSDKSHAIDLNVELVRAYSDPKPTQVYFQTVLLASIAQSENRVFRGTHDVTSWWGSQGEFMRSVHISLDRALGKLHDWLSDRCISATTTTLHSKPAESGCPRLFRRIDRSADRLRSICLTG